MTEPLLHRIARRMIGSSTTIRLVSLMEKIAFKLTVQSRKFLASLRLIDTDLYWRRLETLHRKVDAEIVAQKRNYPHWKYFHGYPYQELGILGIFGGRNTEERFDDYGLAGILTAQDRILDIGCSCGFMAVYSSYRTGCRADGFDINPYMINIGRHVADFFGLREKVSLFPGTFQGFRPERKYTAIYSFASYWTDDKNLRMEIGDHLKTIHGWLEDGGRLIFETHTADAGKPEFHRKLEDMRPLYDWKGSRLLENGRRELFIMRKK